MLKSVNNIFSRLQRLTPLLFVFTGSVLTVVGNTYSINSLIIAGPVVVTVGGLLLVAITFWNSYGDKLAENESAVNGEEFSTSKSASHEQLAPIHYFEFENLSELPGKEIVPPSYEEAVNNNFLKTVQTNIAMEKDEQKLNSAKDVNSFPPTHQEKSENH